MGVLVTCGPFRGKGQAGGGGRALCRPQLWLQLSELVFSGIAFACLAGMAAWNTSQIGYTVG